MKTETKPLFFIYFFNRTKKQTIKLFFVGFDRGQQVGEQFNIFYSKQLHTPDSIAAAMYRRLTFRQSMEFAIPFANLTEAETIAAILSAYLPEKAQVHTAYIQVTELISGKGVMTEAANRLDNERKKKAKKKPLELTEADRSQINLLNEMFGDAVKKEVEKFK